MITYRYCRFVGAGLELKSSGRSLQVLRMVAEGLDSIAALISQRRLNRPSDRHVKQPTTVSFVQHYGVKGKGVRGMKI